MQSRPRTQEDLSQPELRDIFLYGYGISSEEVIKYAYDYYTYAMGIKPIRKKKTRAKIAREFHSTIHGGQLGKEAVHKTVNQIIASMQKDDFRKAKENLFGGKKDENN